MISIWEQIDAALSPIIGQRGVSALFQRSLRLASEDHPWLIMAHHDVAAAIDLDILKSAIAQQGRADASAGATTHLDTFYALLSSLIGAALTGRLLEPVQTNFLSAPTGQDNRRAPQNDD
ncbi:conserved hypothetical protein [Thiomonas sp. X19]|uniref:hypothetical protein n=1 Tax=Thiomonas sp. X19 TaxID=1050370 RepID=UPI000B658124|nr:hypothetical protein [Thiomonas sp. X19]SCC94590.1 conserved hypothetical protein [Thiomonas sp. X19]